MRKPLASLSLFAAIAAAPLPHALASSRAEPMDEAPRLFQLGVETYARQARLAEHYGEVLLAEHPLHFVPDLLIGSAQSTTARSPEIAPRPIAGQRFKVDLPFSKPDRWLRLDTVYESEDGVITWSGTLEGDESSLVTLSLQGETLLGRILSDGVTYILQGDSSTDYRLSAIDSARLPQVPDAGSWQAASSAPRPPASGTSRRDWHHTQPHPPRRPRAQQAATSGYWCSIPKPPRPATTSACWPMRSWRSSIKAWRAVAFRAAST